MVVERATNLVARCLQCVLDHVQSPCDWGMWSYDTIKVHKTEREFHARVDFEWLPPGDRENSRIGEPRLAGEKRPHAVPQ